MKKNTPKTQIAIFSCIGVLILVIVSILCLVLVRNFKNKQKGEDDLVVLNVNSVNYYEYFKGDDNEELQVFLKDFDGEDKLEDYLTVCGGTKPVGKFFKSASESEIRTREDLINFLGEIDSLDKAAAFIWSLGCNYVDEFKGEVAKGKEMDDGYYIELIRYPLFGCGIHAHEKVSYLVKRDGTYEELNSVKLEKGREMCVD